MDIAEEKPLLGGGKIYSPYIRCKEWKRGLIKVLDILSIDPEIFDIDNTIITGGIHRE